jgi:ubiquinone/menaquinone biosynthesis C-methylase UbiE
MDGQPPLAATRNPFAVPSGWLGRLAGWVMGRDDAPHREVADLLAPAPGASICEVGCGPGQLLTVLAGRDPTARLFGVDPSPVMLGQARRRLDRAQVGGRVDLRQGAASQLPLPDGQVDHVVAVNSAAIWPDLGAGLREAARVLRPGGTVLIAWHSARSPNPIQRRLAQPPVWWEQTLAALRGIFDDVVRHDLTRVTAAVAVLPDTPIGYNLDS